MRNVFFILAVFAAVAIVPIKSAAQVLILDNTDTAMGIFLGEPYFPATVEGFSIATENGYLFQMLGPRVDGENLTNKGVLNFQTLQFESQDCTGQGYLQTNIPGILFNPFWSRDISDPEPEAWYVPKHEEIVLRSMNSKRDWRDPNGCTETPDALPRLFGRAYPNDPVETGFTDPSPPWPFKFRTVLDPDLVRCIFRDSFECEA